MTKIWPQSLSVVSLFLAVPVILQADEGMWLFNTPPVAYLKTRYNFDATPAWLTHLQKASVRFDNGGSGSFVSPNGLVMTNQHVGTDCVQNISTQQRDYVKSGFYARTQADEVKCPNLELDVLMSIEDVTARVNAAVPPGTNPAGAEKARRAVMNTIEKESLDKTGLRSNVITLYNGGEYNLYRYKAYTDVRLVFDPEKAAAFFGGDPDNFEYPRYDLDICFFRAYENNQPARTTDYLKWNPHGAADGDLVFVSGNPGSTARLDTMQHLEFLRRRSNPWVLNMLYRREVLLHAWGERSAENFRRSQDQLLEIQNSRKAYDGMEAGLLDPGLMSKKQTEEQALRNAVDRDPKLKAAYGNAWDQVAATIHTLDGIYSDLSLLESGQAFDSRLFEIARTLVRLAEESQKPNNQRLREYSEANLPALKQELFSTAPIYDDLESMKLADSLSSYAEVKGMENELVQKVLAGKSPEQRAEELIHGTKLKDVEDRKRLAAGGLKAMEASNDPMILLARLVDPESRRLRAIYDNQVTEPRRQAYAKIAQARFAIYGNKIYPDATFTLRLSFGQVKGYEQDGKPIAWDTTLGGAFTHAANHDNQPPFQLPPSWMKAKQSLDLAMPLNFVNTADIIGGNSGSPVVNRAGELVGIIFDGNIQSLPLDYIYTDVQARAIAVNASGIGEALKKIYGAQRLASELGLQ